MVYSSSNVSKMNVSYLQPQANNSLRREEREEVLHFLFIFHTIIIPIIASLGLVGNSLTMFVLLRGEIRSPTILYLRALVFTDSAVLLMSVACFAPYGISRISDGMNFYKNIWDPLTYTYFLYALMTIWTCNVWLTVSVTVERYSAICHPLVTLRTTRNTLIVIVAVIAFSIIFNIPDLFSKVPGPCSSGQAQCYERYSTDFGRSDIYLVIYDRWTTLVVMFIIPLAALFLLNILIIIELVRITKRRRALRRHHQANVSLVLVLVVLVFFICQTPLAIWTIGIVPYSLYLAAVSETMVVLNSSVNFIIYVFVGRQFREVFKRTVCHRCVRAPTRLDVAVELPEPRDQSPTATSLAVVQAGLCGEPQPL